MDFALTQEQQGFIDTAKAFAQDQLAPTPQNGMPTAISLKTHCAKLGNWGLWACTPRNTLAVWLCPV